MYSDKRTNQGGSVAIFLIVSVLLAAGVIGGVYFVHQRGERAQGAAQQPIAQVPAPTTNQQTSDEVKKQEEAQKQADAAKQAEEAKKKADAEAQKKQQAAKDQAAKDQAAKDKAAQEKAAKEEAAKRAAQQPTPVPQTSTAPATTRPTPTGTEHLPTTGPADTLVQLIAGGIMVAMVGAYLRSYKYRFDSFIR